MKRKDEKRKERDIISRKRIRGWNKNDDDEPLIGKERKSFT